ncbi:uncharacterized protein HMPREF1541_04077 [Cyphellophora europaea CBS 101466]|uniref:Alpha-1,2-mannosyltransferase n=1 Tax=Cyphellophora europaea (strain CBS 101466) TaxID=1220924 RepID=W2S072_CYPE1|nr:uncharacterized protein HMPREF1541_04077 [Cyphellophora europaea CBS 101466]ETN42136.1 hypothetical protein HMPREF1541_04077 [Cyphellophora europaea CBS 101466]
MLFKWRGRGSQKYGQVLFLFFLVLLIYHALSGGDIITTTTRTHDATPGESTKNLNPFIEDHARFWRALYSHILFNDPECTPPELVGIPHKLDVMYDPKHEPPRPDILWLQPADVQKLKSAHAKFLDDVRTKSPQIPFQPDSRGIVVTAGFSQLPVVAISLRMLRRTGCTLPVEVFLASQADHDTFVCDHIFPSLNAKCLVFQDIVVAAGTGVILTRFQYKIMALLFSSFESVLLLDSDAFPATNPTDLFSHPVFTSHGLILWPDFWYPSESPYYFEIASIHSIPPLNARPATESGEILLNKSQHDMTLILAAYYNYYGPDIYYPLHSQGAPGQGDKETFRWAAVATNSTFYFVHTPVLALGHVDSNGEFFGSAMAQHDPRADWATHRLRSPHPGTEIDNDNDNADDDASYPAPRQRPQEAALANPDPKHPTTPDIRVPPLFIHANFPKFDPGTLFLSTTQPPGRVGPTFDSNGTSVRPWDDTLRAPYDYVGYDLEAAFWEEIKYVSCEWQEGMGAWRKVRGEGVDVCMVVRRWAEKVFGQKGAKGEDTDQGEPAGRAGGEENGLPGE